MTVDAATTNIVGRGLGLAFLDTDADYLYYKGIAEKRVGTNAPDTLEADIKDHCIMLMICHLYASSDPAMGMRSFSSGDFSGSQDAGSTIYLIECNQIYADNQSLETGEVNTSTTRSDAVMTELQLDRAEVPRLFAEDKNALQR